MDRQECAGDLLDVPAGFRPWTLHQEGAARPQAVEDRVVRVDVPHVAKSHAQAASRGARHGRTQLKVRTCTRLVHDKPEVEVLDEFLDLIRQRMTTKTVHEVRRCGVRPTHHQQGQIAQATLAL